MGRATVKTGDVYIRATGPGKDDPEDEHDPDGVPWNITTIVIKDQKSPTNWITADGWYVDLTGDLWKLEAKEEDYWADESIRVIVTDHGLEIRDGVFSHLNEAWSEPTVAEVERCIQQLVLLRRYLIEHDKD